MAVDGPGKGVFAFLCACTGGGDAHPTLTPTPSPLVNCGEMNLLLQQHYCDSAGAAGEEDNGDNIGCFS